MKSKNKVRVRVNVEGCGCRFRVSGNDSDSDEKCEYLCQKHKDIFITMLFNDRFRIHRIENKVREIIGRY